MSESFQIVLAGETYFKKIRLPTNLPAADSRPLSIHALLRHRGVGDQVSRNITVEWRGTALEAAQEGKRLRDEANCEVVVWRFAAGPARSLTRAREPM